MTAHRFRELSSPSFPVMCSTSSSSEHSLGLVSATTDPILSTKIRSLTWCTLGRLWLITKIAMPFVCQRPHQSVHTFLYFTRGGTFALIIKEDLLAPHHCADDRQCLTLTCRRISAPTALRLTSRQYRLRQFVAGRIRHRLTIEPTDLPRVNPGVSVPGPRRRSATRSARWQVRRSWYTVSIPAMWASRGERSTSSLPSRTTRPRVGRTVPESTPTRVDFPAPLWPTIGVLLFRRHAAGR